MIYREHKRLRAISLVPAAGGGFAYSMQIGTEAEGRLVSGTVRADGTIREDRSEPAILTCPICLPAGTRIDTPAGPMLVEEVREVTASPGHPTAEGRRLGLLRPGERLDGAVITSVQRVSYGGKYVYDLFPAGATGLYWADGVLIGRTIS